MSDEVCLSYDELCEKLRSEIGRQVFQLALQARVIARTADSQLRGDYANPRDMSGTIAQSQGYVGDHRPDSGAGLSGPVLRQEAAQPVIAHTREIGMVEKVGVGGFEPPTSWSQTRRAYPCATPR